MENNSLYTMIHFSESELQYFRKKVNVDVERLKKMSQTEEVVANLEILDILDWKLKCMQEISLGYDMKGDLEVLRDIFDKLDGFIKTYHGIKDITQLEQYDHIKKEFALHMSTLAEYCGRFITLKDTIKDRVKKHLRQKVINLIMTADKEISQSAAEKMVESDDRYIRVYEEMNILIQTANVVIKKWETYSEMQRSVNQSVSTSRRDNQSYNNRHTQQ